MKITNPVETLNSFSRAETVAVVESPAATSRPVPVSEPPRGDLSAKELADVVQMANKALKLNNSNLKFMMDPDSTKPIVQIVDQETQEVLKQIPSVEMLKIAKALEKMQGVLMSREV